MILLHLTKLSEVRIAGDQPNNLLDRHDKNIIVLKFASQKNVSCIVKLHKILLLHT